MQSDDETGNWDIECVDIRTGVSVRRQLLIDLLREENYSEDLQLIRAECGVWNGDKLLRVYTRNAQALMSYIVANQELLLLEAGTQYRINTSPDPDDDDSAFLPDYDVGAEERNFDF